MTDLEVQFLGSGDAFSSGGRFHTCILVSSNATRFLVDCGASSMVAMRRFGVEPNDLEMILITHLHGDHYGGLPFFMLDARLVSRRTQPLRLVGPPGLEVRYRQLMEALFAGTSQAKPKFPLVFEELQPGQVFSYMAHSGEEIQVEPFEVAHSSGSLSFAYRIACGDKKLAYTGDTSWCEGIVQAAKETDLLITECCSYEKELRNHLNYQTLQAHREELKTPRIIYTHMNMDMLEKVPQLVGEFASDGKVFRI